jgi:S-phase kinase-associated protein 1
MAAASSDPVTGLQEDDQLTLRGEDDSETRISAKAASMSGLLDGALWADPHARVINLSFKGPVLKKVAEYLEYRSKVPPPPIPCPLPNADLKECVDEWDYNFTNMDLALLLSCIVASNYMIIIPMMELCCAKFASILKSKTPEEIQNIFNISPPTPEDKANAMKLFEEIFPDAIEKKVQD